MLTYTHVLAHTLTHAHTQISTSKTQTLVPARGKSLAAGTNEVPVGFTASHLLL